jgi:hypothetical protein
MQFDCPRCGTAGTGVLLFNLVAPCDRCSGIVTTKPRKSGLEVMTIEEMSKLEPKPWGYAWFGTDEKKESVEDCLKYELKRPDEVYWSYTEYISSATIKRLNYPNTYVIVMWEKDKK